METAMQIERFRRQYFQLVDPHQLVMPPLNVMKLPHVQDEIYNTMFSSGISFLPPERYRFRVLKRLLYALQEAFKNPEEDEISDSLTACFARLVALPPLSEIDSAQQKGFVTYTIPINGLDAPSITTLEVRSVLAASGNTGVRTWEAALRLGAFLSSDAGKQYVAGMNILELGAGTGFLSILCAKHLDARFVLATDGSGEVVGELDYNISLNGLEGAGAIEPAVLKWGHVLPDAKLHGQEEARQYQLILGADITYDEDTAPALVLTLHDLFARYHDAKALISATLRNEKTLNAFMDACGESLQWSMSHADDKLIPAAADGLHTERLQIPLAKEETQLGFFIPTSSPILVFLITRSGTKSDIAAISSSKGSQ